AFAACTTPGPRGRRGGWTSVVAGLLMMLWYAECRGGWLAAVAPREPLPAAYPLEETVGPSPVTEALRGSDGVVLELPLLPRGIAGRPHAKAMFRSIFHWRPLLNGYRSYYPTGFAERMALAQRVPDPVALATLQRDAGLTHLIVNVHSAFARTVWLRAAAAHGSRLRLVSSDDTVLLFEVTPVRPG
ncbi:MAG: hypothetical protein ACREQL_14715, partial [Candidatus Binatia bacterium]